MSASGSGPRTRADAAKEADDTDNAPPAPLSVQMRGQHRAAWLTETELVRVARSDTRALRRSVLPTRVVP